jgi:hypothetical protein
VRDRDNGTDGRKEDVTDEGTVADHSVTHPAVSSTGRVPDETLPTFIPSTESSQSPLPSDGNEDKVNC